MTDHDADPIADAFARAFLDEYGETPDTPAPTTPAGPTYRERREARAERLREWADKNATRADAAHDAAHELADAIPFGQPILVGHHSERRARRDRDRIQRGMERGHELDTKAREQAARADEIERAAARAIYDDDPDAIERLAEKLAGLEAERARWKAYNAACRKAKQSTAEALALLDDRQRADLAGTAKVSPYMIGNYGQAPKYHVANLAGTIKATRDRIARLTARKARTGTTAKPARMLALRYAGTCVECAAELDAGTVAFYDRAARAVTCQPCHDQGDRQ